MLNIAIKPFYGKIFLNNKIFSISNSPNIFFGLDRKLRQKGILINTIDIKNDNVDRIVYCDVPYPWEIYTWMKIIMNINKNLLLCFESPLVNPFSHLNINRYLFQKIATWDDNKIDEKKYFKMCIPYNTTKNKILKIKWIEKKLLVLVNSYKNSPFVFRLISPYKKNLYDKRLDIICFLEEKYPGKLDLYGNGWQNYPKKLSSYKGGVEYKNKINLISKYKFCLCFENSIADGYITEKIFDCMSARCVPIYYGSSNIIKYINKKCFIDYRDFKNDTDLMSFIENMNEDSYNKYLVAIKKQLNNKKFTDKWFQAGFVESFSDFVR